MVSDTISHILMFLKDEIQTALDTQNAVEVGICVIEKG
jgi:hypothetical protein